MCGISLLINNSSEARSSIESMMNANQHRGPDASGLDRVTDGIWLAVNRLKILDLSSSSNQPLWNEDKSCVLAWNGAIYNYKELRAELNRHKSTVEIDSDSAVLLAWMSTYGKNGIQDLKGMFAITFIDLQKQKIIVTRDISGEKPLYYANQGHEWIFSSEARAVNIAYNQTSSINTSQFSNYFYHRHSEPDESFFQGVKQLVAGQVITLDLEGNLIESSYFSKNIASPKPFSQAEFELTLKKSVHQNFQSDRPVGILLSGGADSALLHKLYLEEFQEPVHTFTAVFDSKYQRKYNDSKFAKRLVSNDPQLHHEVYVDQKVIMNTWNEYIASLDQPIGDSASILTWLIAKEAKKHVSVLISGAGADEVLGGYQRHAALLNYLKYKKLLIFFLPLLKRLPLSSNISKFVNGIHPDPRISFMNFAALSNLPKSNVTQAQRWYPDTGNFYKDALAFDRNYYLTNDVLKVHDNACMAHGVEGRSPYLYKDLVNWITQLSEGELIPITGKKPIKSALKSKGLKMIAQRKKFGFGLPLQEWIGEDDAFRIWIYDEVKMMADRWGSYFPEEMYQLCTQPEQVEGRQFLLVWNMFILASWLKIKS
ncbi:asparagine synthase (glutamine-hydrolyzing) [Belliella kenyensis]|uniref:asparagine synthase (glutamine-hydrolyzing) n=1 Tax=Belliella kenyensis TaxID=1472724 RepID=A0ABV8EQ58_9BACT|nr:asparagine synthase (glutamine-hydrolyzing) [Belliella kenyensis]MCH7401557.1 asparagine synthase (glutamine-hydrolyzing) [Belliella kenyensis]MDN3603163.1 asparagine synthase (glutamine-hydrolyzing) [Belliella kenyensis]